MSEWVLREFIKINLFLNNFFFFKYILGVFFSIQRETAAQTVTQLCMLAVYVQYVLVCWGT